jgi:glycosyltransferase involved in cell wall biosynthesis
MESEVTLRRCLDSVKAQTYQARHFLVFDGAAPDFIKRDYPETRLIELHAAHADYGDTPRGIGALCALNEGFDVVCFLDADNLYLPTHVESVTTAFERARASGQPVDVVCSLRYIFLPDHPELRLADPEDLSHAHVDSSCFSLHRSIAYIWPMWGLIPRGAAPVGDRIFMALLHNHGVKLAWTEQFTVLYESNWGLHYQQAGLPVPADGLHDLASKGIQVSISEDEMVSRLRMPRVRK